MYTKQYRIILHSCVFVLMILGFGADCPGSGGATKFSNAKLASLISSASTTTRTWHTMEFVDQGAVDSSDASLNHAQNILTVGAAVSPYPMCVIADSSKSFHIIYNRGDTIAPAQINAFVNSNSNISSNIAWANSYSTFTQLDTSGAGQNVQRPMAVVDSSSTITSMFLATGTTAVRRPFVTRKVSGSGGWTVASDISNTAEVTGALASAAIAVDAYNNPVMVWIQNSLAYFNQYRVGLGWRFRMGVGTGFTSAKWHDPANLPSDLGVGLGFDSYGNGIGVYTSGVNIIAARWQGALLANFSTTGLYQNISTGIATTVYGYPKVMVLSNGYAQAFFYSNYDTVDSAELQSVAMAATSSSGTLSFSTPASNFDSGYGSGTSVVMQDGTDVLPPLVASNGNYGVAAFIKTNGSVRRLYVRRNYAGSWSDLGVADSGIVGENVVWADVAINASGDVAVAYSVDSTADANNEHVYANIYQDGVWKGVTQLDNSAYVTAGAYPTNTRPSVAIDAGGNAVVSFSFTDNAAIPRRRAVTATWH